MNFQEQKTAGRSSSSAWNYSSQQNENWSFCI